MATARAGLAICDPTEVVVRPLDVVSPPDPEAVARVVRDEEAELVVVGLPLSLDGSEGPQARVARGFRDRLAEVLGGSGGDLRRTPDDANGRCLRPRGRRGGARFAGRSPPARGFPRRATGRGLTEGSDWQDPYTGTTRPRASASDAALSATRGAVSAWGSGSARRWERRRRPRLPGSGSRWCPALHRSRRRPSSRQRPRPSPPRSSSARPRPPPSSRPRPPSTPRRRRPRRAGPREPRSPGGA